MVGAAIIGAAAGAILGSFQWLALRRMTSRGWVWVQAHAAAWSVGMFVALAGIRSILDQSELTLTILGDSRVGLAMCGVVAALTGLALVPYRRGAKARRVDRCLE